MSTRNILICMTLITAYLFIDYYFDMVRERRHKEEEEAKQQEEEANQAMATLLTKLKSTSSKKED